MGKGNSMKSTGKIANDRYWWLKEHGICVACGCQNAFGNYVRCAKCLEKASNASSKLWNDEAKRIQYNANGNKRKKELREERKEKHLCITCGIELTPRQTETTCKRCRAKRNAQRREARGRTYGEAFRERLEKGVCMYCGKPVTEGYKFCQEHLMIKRKAEEKSFEKRTEKWRKEIGASWRNKKTSSENI